MKCLDVTLESILLYSEVMFNYVSLMCECFSFVNALVLLPMFSVCPFVPRCSFLENCRHVKIQRLLARLSCAVVQQSE